MYISMAVSCGKSIISVYIYTHLSIHPFCICMYMYGVHVFVIVTNDYEFQEMTISNNAKEQGFLDKVSPP